MRGFAAQHASDCRLVSKDFLTLIQFVKLQPLRSGSTSGGFPIRLELLGTNPAKCAGDPVSCEARKPARFVRLPRWLRRRGWAV